MLKNNKKALRFVTLAACGLLITGCADILATPTDYETVLVDGTVTAELTNNIESVVYDALKTGGNVNSAVLDGVLLKLAENKFGTFAQAKIDAATDTAKAAFVADIADRVNEKLFALATTGSYETENKFSEERFAQYVRKQLYAVTPTAGYFKDIVFTPAITKDNFNGIAIHLDYYTSYVEGVLVPEIYREKLVEQYLLDEEYSTLGRSYARKVNYIAITKNPSHPEAAKYLIDTFIENNILAPTATAADANLEILANAWRGVASDFISNEEALLEAADVKSVAVGSEYDYTGFGAIMADYAKINPDRLLTDTAVEASFTGSGSYVPSVGLEIKTNTLRKEDYTTDGWYVKNGGLTNLPTEIRNRLFNIGTANGVDHTSDEFDGAAEVQTSDYVRNIHGKYYLIPQNSQQGDEKNFLLYDAASSTYYIVQVEEAINTTKMNDSATSTSNYTALGKDLAAISGKVAKVLGAKDANKTTAMNFYLEEAGIVFHDQDIWKYFQDNFKTLYA